MTPPLGVGTWRGIRNWWREKSEKRTSKVQSLEGRSRQRRWVEPVSSGGRWRLSPVSPMRQETSEMDDKNKVSRPHLLIIYTPTMVYTGLGERAEEC